LALMVGGMLFLGHYQDRLVLSGLDAVRTHARILADTLAVTAGSVDREGVRAPGEQVVRQVLRQLSADRTLAIQVFDAGGGILADSRWLIKRGALPAVPDPANQGGGQAAGGEAAEAGAAGREVNGPVWPLPVAGGATVVHPQVRARFQGPPDLRQALAGEGDAGVWVEEGSGLFVTAAEPIRWHDDVLGVVLLTRSGRMIEEAITSVRYEVVRIFAVALLVNVLLSLYLARILAEPIRCLAMAAEQVIWGRVRLPELPDYSSRNDEIGDLSTALRTMTAIIAARLGAIERFAADVAHEIKNPLSSLASAVETVGRVETPERRAALLAIIRDDVRRLDRLITDISAASRLDAEMSRAEPMMVDLGGMLLTLADARAATISAAGMPAKAGAAVGTDDQSVRLVVEVAPGASTLVPGIEDRLVQVFQNLLGNAYSFSPPGATVAVRVREEGEWVEVTVADQGPGIPAGKNEAIFERFYSERPSAEKYGTHSGLGLSISRQIVEAHGGTVTARNLLPDEMSGVQTTGALFTVRLPRA